MLNKKTQEIKSPNAMSVHVIGNDKAALIVSNKGHFDFRVNKKSVFGRVFDPQNREFTGKSPTFIMASGGKRVNFSCDRVESTHGCITMFSGKIALCFTVDTERRELLAKVVSNTAPKEYILCVSGHRIAVNSYNFDKICEKLSKATRYGRFRHRIYTEDGDAQKLYLFACFFDLFHDTRLTKFWSVQDFKRIVSKNRTLCVSLPGGFSEKAQSFVRNLLCYSKYIKSVYGFGVDLAFYDPKGEFLRFFEQNKLKKYTKDEFELLKTVSVGNVELAMDFDSKVLLNDMISQTALTPTSVGDVTHNEKASELKMGVLKAVIGKKAVDSVSFSFKDRGSLTVRSLDFVLKKGTGSAQMSDNMRIQGVGDSMVDYRYAYGNPEGLLTVGTDKSLPFWLMYAEKVTPDLDLSLKFSLDTSGISLTQQMIRVSGTGSATVFTPMIYENEKISLFVIKNEDQMGSSVVIGAFSGEKDALLYKALEKYPSCERVKAELLRPMTKDERTCALACIGADDQCQIVKRAIAICESDCKIAKNYIIWALCFQNIDGSLPCEGSAAKALACYLENSCDKEILSLDLPYMCDGKFTSRKESVFMHVMRAAELEQGNEDQNALDYLRKLYYEAE